MVCYSNRSKKVMNEARNLRETWMKKLLLLILEMVCVKDTHFETHAHINSASRVAQHPTVLPETVAPADGVKVQRR